MITIKKKTLYKFLLWILIYMTLMTIVVASIIHFLNEPAEIFYQAHISSLSIGMFVFGTLAFMVLKKQVGHGKSRKTYFKESIGTVLFLSLYSMILMNVFSWGLNLFPSLSGEIFQNWTITEIIILNIVAILSGLLTYFIGLIVFYSFVKNFILGIFVCFIVGGLGGYYSQAFGEFTTMNVDNPLLVLGVQIFAIIMFGIIARAYILNAAIKV